MIKNFIIAVLGIFCFAALMELNKVARLQTLRAPIEGVNVIDWPEELGPNIPLKEGVFMAPMQFKKHGDTLEVGFYHNYSTSNK